MKNFVFNIFRIIKSLFLILILSFLLIFLLEILVRTKYPFPLTTLGTYKNFDDVIYFHKNNSKGTELSFLGEYDPVLLSYNEYGFRSDFTGDNGKELKFVVGDSFVEARQVKESLTFVELLNQKISNSFFVNAGCSAYTTPHYYLLIKNRILDFKPKEIFLLFSFNDYMDNYTYHGGFYNHPTILDGINLEKFQPKVFSNKYRNLKDYLLLNSSLYGFLKYFFTSKKLPKKNIVSSNSFYNSLVGLNKSTKSFSDTELKVFNFTHNNIILTNSLLKKSKIDFKIIILPLPNQIDKQEWNIGKSIFYGFMENSREKRTIYQRRFLLFCKKNEIKCFDPLDYFIQKREENLFFSYDGHLTTHGHKVLSEFIAEHMIL